MSDTTLRLTFSQLRIRVAEYLGLAPIVGSVAALPSDAHDLDLVGRLVNDGMRRFISESERWSFLNAPLSIRFVPQLTGSITARTGVSVTVGDLAGDFADDFFNGYQITLVDAATGDETIQTVTDYTGATGLFTVAAVPAAIQIGDTIKYSGAENVGGQAYRYFLPDDFYGLLKAPFTYDTSGPHVVIEEVPEVEIRAYRAGAQSTGTPSVVAFRPINTTAASDGNRWEALFWPEPSGTELVSAVYKRFPQALSASGDVCVAGFQHDATVLAAALAAAELYRNDRIGIHEQSYQLGLARSAKLDARATPARSHPYGDRSGEASFRRPSSYARITSFGGVTL